MFFWGPMDGLKRSVGFLLRPFFFGLLGLFDTSAVSLIVVVVSCWVLASLRVWGVLFDLLFFCHVNV